MGMKVVVTGGSGRLGQHVIRELLDHGHQVLSLDKTASPAPLCPSWIVDLRDPGAIYEALGGAEGVVHLGAYQKPGMVPDTETFSNNIMATYNVLKAAADLRITRVAIASSIAAFGFLYAPCFWPPDYLPLDEGHPCKPQDPYGLSKLLGETVADGFAASHPMTILSLRFPGVNFDLSYRSFPERWKDPGARLGGFWSYIDARDAADALRLALEAKLSGHRVLNVAAPASSMKEPTDDLIGRYLPGVRKAKKPLTANWSGMDSTRAEAILGFKAKHTWEKYLTL
jgi:nucleoside-diphosphate-sugar epimerase